MTYVVSAVWRAKEGCEDRIGAIVGELAGPSRAEPGCLFYQPHRAPQDPQLFYLYEQYADQAAYEAHMDSEHFTRLVKQEVGGRRRSGRTAGRRGGRPAGRRGSRPGLPYTRHACGRAPGARRGLRVLLWQRAREPSGAWSLPGGYLGPDDTLEAPRAHLTRKVDVAELSCSSSSRRSEPGRHPEEWQLATAYLGLVPAGSTPLCPGHRVAPVDRFRGSPSTSRRSPRGRERLRAKLSYTNIGFALAPEKFSISELSAIYTAALGYASSTNLRRVLERRGLLEATG